MSTPLHSAQWYRVAELRPQLAPQVRVRRREERGEAWFVLSDPLSGRHHLVDAAGYEIVGRLDGERSLDQIWAALLQRFPHGLPPQDELIGLLARLDAAGLLRRSGALRRSAAAVQAAAPQRRDGRSFNPLALRLPLFDPRGLLRWLTPLCGWAFHPLAAVLWLGLLAVAAVAASVHAAELAAAARLSALGTRQWLIALLSFPFIKVLHELAHGVAVHRFGGEVRQFGLSFMLLMPAPYVDASAAGGFSSRWQRVGVSAAGIVVEVALAAAALLLWLAVEPGWVRDTALVVMLVSGLSTVLVNANPLMRFDGYHMLCDALALPNLASRSGEWWRWALRRHALRLRHVPPPHPARGVTPWLVAYAPASWAYQALMCAAVALWLADRYAPVAALLAASGAWMLLGKPAWRLLRYALSSAELQGRRARAGAFMAAVSALAAVLLFGVPAPSATVAEGVAWLPEDAIARAQSDGFVVQLHAANGQRVSRGDLLLSLENEDLRHQVVQARAKLLAAEVELRQAQDSDPGRGRAQAAELERARAELTYLEGQQQQLALRSQADGVFRLARPEDLPGRLAQRGSTLGYVLERDTLRVRVAVPQAQSLRVREHTRSVSVLAAGRQGPPQPVAAQLAGEVPRAGTELPSAALGAAAGGRFETDPADTQGLRALQPVAVFDVTVPGVVARRVGERLQVRFDHGSEPLARQWSRELRQLLLKHVDAPAEVAAAGAPH